MSEHTHLLALFACIATVACGGGGPGVSGPEAQTLFADYSASWVLDEASSDSVPQRIGAPPGGEGRSGGGGRDPFGGGGDPFAGGSTGGRPTGGMSGRGGGGGRGGPGGGPNGRGTMDPERMEGQRHTMTAARRRPDRLTLELNDTVLSFAQSPGGRAAVPTNGDEVELSRSGWPTKAKVEWDDGMPQLKRAFENGGTIVDHFELVSRTRLLLTRRVEGGPGDDIELRFVYQREGPDEAG